MIETYKSRLELTNLAMICFALLEAYIYVDLEVFSSINWMS